MKFRRYQPYKPIPWEPETETGLETDTLHLVLTLESTRSALGS
jgi:hypothetical protein